MPKQTKEPITLTAKSRRNLYLSTRERMTKTDPEILVEFDRLHNEKHHEYPFLHEFRLGHLVGYDKRKQEDLLSNTTFSYPRETKLLTAWADGVLRASAKINAQQDLIDQLVKESI